MNPTYFDQQTGFGMSNQMRNDGSDGLQLAIGLNAPTLQSECFVQDFRLPACYNLSKPKELLDGDIKTFSDPVLFYVFYNMPNDRAQIQAASQLQQRGWVYVEEEMIWVKQSGN